MQNTVISIWGDSIGKGVMFDEGRNRHVICRDSYESCLKQKGVDVRNYAVMGCTAPKGESLMTEERMQDGGIAVIEFGGNDSDLDWKAVCEHPEEEADHLVRVTIPDFCRSLKNMIARAREFGLKPILSTPLPVIADRYLEWISRALDKDKILSYLGAAEYIYRWQERYDIAVRGIAAKLNVALFMMQLKVPAQDM